MMIDRRSTGAVLLAVLLATAVALALWRVGTSEGRSSRERTYVADVLVGVDSAARAVTWADTVAVFTVASEREVGGSAETSLVGRTVEVRIEKVIWQRRATLQPPSVFRTQAAGRSREDDGAVVPLRPETGVRLEVGRTYLAPVLRLAGQWGFDESMLEVVDGVVRAAPQQRSRWRPSSTASPCRRLRRSSPAPSH